MFDRKLTSDLRPILKRPLGRLLIGPASRTKQRLKPILRRTHPPLLIAVGDVSSRIAVELAYQPRIVVLDRKIKRRDAPKLPVEYAFVLKTKNPRGQLTAEARATIRSAIRFGGSTTVYVSGEEDLLALPAVLYAPLRSIIIYGQPDEGLVIIRVTTEKKRSIKWIISKMKVSK